MSGAEPLEEKRGEGGAPEDPGREELLARLLFDCAERVNAGQSLETGGAISTDAGIRESRELDLALDLLSASVPSPDSPPLPDAIGDHRILREVGRGGMGVVYEAVELSLGRRVALKVLPLPALTTGGRRERFLREARAAAKLHHTRIVPVFEVGEEGGLLYYTMQYIGGRSLDRVLRALSRRRASGAGPGEEARPEPPGAPPDETAESIADALAGGPGAPPAGRAYHRAVARIGVEVAGALAHAHQEGILHRDVKPSNLILDLQGSAWLTDFGLARNELEGESLTLTGDVVGTAAYLAPERLSGREDGRSDVYSLGATLYELLALEPPFRDADRRRLLQRISQEEARPLRRLVPRLPPDLETIVMQAIAREPERRYASPSDLAADLERFLRGEPISARRLGPAGRTALWCRRHPLIASLAASVLILLGCLLAVTVVSARSLRERLIAAEISTARAQRLGGRSGRRFASLEAVERASRLGPSLEQRAALRDEALAALSLADLREVRRRPEPIVSPSAKAFDRELERYAIIDPRREEIVVRRIADGAELERSARIPGVQDLIDFSPDGRLLAARARREGRFQLLLLSSPGLTPRLEFPSGTRSAQAAFDPRGGRAALRDPEGDIALLDLSTLQVSAVLRSGFRTGSFRYAPSGERLAVQPAESSRLVILDSAAGRRETEIVPPTATLDFAWSPDGLQIATASEAGQIHLWSARSGDLLLRLEGHLGSVVRLHYSPAGGLLFSTSWDATLRLWDPASGELLLTTMDPGSDFASSPDGDRWVSVGRDVVLWQVARGSERRVIRCLAAPRTTGGHKQSVHPGGRMLANSWGLLDLERGLEIPGLGRGGEPEDWSFQSGGKGVWGGRGATIFERSIELREGEGAGALRIGRKRPRPLPGLESGVLTSDAAGRWIAGIDARSRILVLDLAAGGAAIIAGEHPGADRVQLSPDGRWAASGTWNRGLGAKVWDLRERREVLEVFPDRAAQGSFSPDGRWFAAWSDEEYGIWRTGDWLPKLAFRREIREGAPGCLAWAPDGRSFAVTITQSEAEIRDLETSRPLARLASIQPRWIQLLSFSPDGEKLIFGCANATTEVWDLRRLREELRPLGLDLEAPPTGAGASRGPTRPIRLEWEEDQEAGSAGEAKEELPSDPIELEDLAQRLERKGEWAAALRASERALALTPASALSHNQLAWILANAPDPLRNPERAIALARIALRGAPEYPSFLNTLGAAQLRAGRFQESIDTLLASARASGGLTAWDGFFLAIALERLGLHSLAREKLEDSLRWIERHPDLSADDLRELGTFRSEAAAALGTDPGGRGPAATERKN